MNCGMIISGFGGQGVMLMGQMIGKCAFDRNMSVTVMPSYGPEQRGGTANTTVVLSDAYVSSPVADNPDVLCAMNQPSVDRFAPTLRQGGMLFLNSTLCEAPTDRTDLRIVAAPVDDMALELGSPKVANIIMLGIMVACLELFPHEDFARVVEEKLAKKPELREINKKAFERGLQLGENSRKAFAHGDQLSGNGAQ